MRKITKQLQNNFDKIFQNVSLKGLSIFDSIHGYIHPALSSPIPVSNGWLIGKIDIKMEMLLKLISNFQERK